MKNDTLLTLGIIGVGAFAVAKLTKPISEAVGGAAKGINGVGVGVASAFEGAGSAVSGAFRDTGNFYSSVTGAFKSPFDFVGGVINAGTEAVTDWIKSPNEKIASSPVDWQNYYATLTGRRLVAF